MCSSAWCWGLVLGASAPAWAQHDAAVPRGYVHDLQITDVKPVGAAIIEHEPVVVGYTLTVTSYGIVGTLPPLTRLRVCPAADSDPNLCREIGVPRLRRRYTGTLRVPAPAAGEGVPIGLVVLKAPPVPPGEGYGWAMVAEQARPTLVAPR